MHIARKCFALAPVAGGFVAAGGTGEGSCELYDEASGLWILLPCTFHPVWNSVTMVSLPARVVVRSDDGSINATEHACTELK
jgi:hypothetical protein